MNKTSEKCLIVGTGGQCRVIISILAQLKAKYTIAGIIDVEKPDLDERIMGMPVIGSVEETTRLLDEGITHAFLAFGDNKKRKQYIFFIFVLII